ncbi:MAG: hypothetical protein M3548_09495 [Actinomycetota bacterium]|nr:hypothetical protein [Actinomycetota bacterium]
MDKALKIGAWVNIGEDCDMKYTVHDHDDVDFLSGEPPKSFEFVFKEQSLARFVALATQALAKAKAMRDQDGEPGIDSESVPR